MKVFFFFFVVATILCAYFWITDEPGSGMGLATGIFGGLMLGVGGYNWGKFGSPFRDKLPSA
jgi:hypothetical protein